MSRKIKKIIYGLIYLAVLAFVVFEVYQLFIDKTPTCFDKKQNQNETGIDCGGQCTACDILKLEDIRISSPVKMFYSETSKRFVFLVEIVNPNDGYKAESFEYIFEPYDLTNHLIKNPQIIGTNFVFSNEKKYVFSSIGETGNLKFENIGKVEFKVSKVDWKKSYEDLRSELLIYGNPVTKVEKNGIEVSGLVKNQGSFAASDIGVIAILFDEFGSELFASQTVISGISGFGENEFLIKFPGDSNIIKRTDPRMTKVFISGK